MATITITGLSDTGVRKEIQVSCKDKAGDTVYSSPDGSDIEITAQGKFVIQDLGVQPAPAAPSRDGFRERG